MRIGFFAVAVVVAICAGCVSNPMASGPKHTPLNANELQQKIDLVLDFESGRSDALPDDLFVLAPDSEKGTDDIEEIKATAADMKARHAEIETLRAKQILGEDHRGYLALRNDDSFENAADKNAAQQTMSTQNECRKAVYRGIARASEEKGLTLTRVERMFAARRMARSQSGALVQLPSNDAEFAAFQQTPLGQKLGTAARPGDWVAVP